MRRVAPLLALVGSLAFLAGAGGGTYRGGSYRGGTYDVAAGSYPGAAAAAVDTIRVRSRSALFPNQNAITAGYQEADSTHYDFDNKGDDGSTLMYGYLNRGAPTTTYFSAANAGRFMQIVGQGTYREDNWTSWYTNQYLGCVWVSANGLKAGMEVRTATLLINVDRNGFTTTSATNAATITVHLDTTSADYEIVNHSAVGASYGTSNEPARFAFTWNNMDGQAASMPWTPPLEDRKDWHDFGPRSVTTIPPGSFTRGQVVPFDVVDAVQQVLDKAAATGDDSYIERGFLFWITMQGAIVNPSALPLATLYWAAGNDPAHIGQNPTTGAGGNPVFVCEAVTRRGPMVWGNGKVKVAFSFDDNHPYHPSFAAVMDANGLKFASATNGLFTPIPGQGPDSLLCVDLPSRIILPHTPAHTPVGELTGSALEAALSRDWLDLYSCWPAILAADTTNIRYFAYPSGGGREYSPEAVARLARLGYTAGRGRNHAGALYGASDPTPLGTNAVHPPYWSRPQNMLAFMTWGAWEAADNLPGTTATVAEIQEKLGDIVDMAYSHGVALTGRFGHGAVVLYAHNLANDGTDAVELQRIIDVATQWHGTEVVDFDTLIEMRLAGTSYLDPADITVANGYLAQDETAAAVLDSFRTYHPDATLGEFVDQAWVSPK